MPAPRSVVRWLPLPLIVLGLGVSARGQLTTNSPFLPPPSAAAATAPTASAPLEFRGFIDMPGDGLKIRIYDPARKIGTWLRIDERDPNFEFVVKQYDAGRDTATVEYRGQTLVLAQHEAKVTSSGAVAPNLPLVQTMAVPSPMLPGPNTPNGQSPLDATAAAVAQRRAAREQAAQQINPGLPAVPQQRPPVPPQRQLQRGSGPPNQNGSQRGAITVPGRRGG